MKLNKSIIIALVIIVVIIVIAAAILLSGPKTNSNGNPTDTNNISITSGLAFSPSSLTIHVGDNVTWTNDASISHTVVSDTSSAEIFSSGVLTHGQTYKHQFNQTGVFTYHCSIHPSMTGTITVIA